MITLKVTNVVWFNENVTVRLIGTFLVLFIYRMIYDLPPPTMVCFGSLVNRMFPKLTCNGLIGLSLIV